MSSKAWGGRFEEELDAVAAKMNASVAVDSRLAEDDIRGSLAHAEMLQRSGILSRSDFEAIQLGLGEIREEIRAGKMLWRDDREDVHMNIETVLREKIGEAGGRLHTARSRNDQVATDMRLFVRNACDVVVSKIDLFLAVLVQRADEEIDTLMPGYTHMQRAQPVRLAHHLLAWCEMLERDRGRLLDARKRLNESPLGAAALAGTTFPIDRNLSAELLGFDAPTRNSLDSVSDRDFLLETVSALSICAIHLSRISEELVLWSTQEFGFISMSDKFTTGSSIMPQKKNPDMAELVRGKCGRVVGDLVTLLVLMKGLPLSYNRDMQEDKQPFFDAYDTVSDSLDVLRGAMATAVFGREAMRKALKDGFLDATEVADWLANAGVPFRDAHHVSGRLVKLCTQRGCTLSDLSLEDFQNEDRRFDQSIFAALIPEAIVERRDVVGGPARARVKTAIDFWNGLLATRDLTNDKESK